MGDLCGCPAKLEDDDEGEVVDEGCPLWRVLLAGQAGVEDEGEGHKNARGAWEESRAVRGCKPCFLGTPTAPASSDTDTDTEPAPLPGCFSHLSSTVSRGQDPHTCSHLAGARSFSHLPHTITRARARAVPPARGNKAPKGLQGSGVPLPFSRRAPPTLTPVPRSARDTPGQRWQGRSGCDPRL